MIPKKNKIFYLVFLSFALIISNPGFSCISVVLRGKFGLKQHAMFSRIQKLALYNSFGQISGNTKYHKNLQTIYH